MLQSQSSHKREIAPMVSNLLMVTVFHHLQSSSFRGHQLGRCIFTSKFQSLTSAGQCPTCNPLSATGTFPLRGFTEILLAMQKHARGFPSGSWTGIQESKAGIREFCGWQRARHGPAPRPLCPLAAAAITAAPPPPGARTGQGGARNAEQAGNAERPE